MSLTVLLIDDQVEFLDLAQSLLASHPGITIVGMAQSGEEALALVLRHDPDGVILDVNLSGMSGFEVARRLVGSSPRLRLVLLSAFHHDEYEALAHAAGAVAFLAKRDLSADTIYSLIGGRS